MSEQTPEPFACTLPVVVDLPIQQFSPDAIYQAAACGCTDDLRVAKPCSFLQGHLHPVLFPKDILILCDELTKEQMLEWADNFERTALIMATQEGHDDCIQLLLSQGANVDHMCTLRPGGTALHLAIFLNRPKSIVHQLLCHGADPFVVNDAGITPWDISLSNEHPCSVMFASFALFEGLLCIKDSKRFGPDDDLKSFWVRIIPRYCRLDHRHGKHLVGLRLCVHWRVHGESVCEIDLQGSSADIIVHDQDGFSYALLISPSNKILSCNEYMMGSICHGDIATLWLRGRTKTLDDFLNLVNNVRVFSSVDAVYANEDISDGERDCLPPDLESSFDELSLTEESSTSSSPLTINRHSDENGRPHGLAGSKPLTCSKSRRTTAHVSSYERQLSSMSRRSTRQLRAADEEHLCVICLDKPKTVGFVHGKSMHICACERCAEIISRGSNRCPLCREAIQHTVMKIY